MVFFILCFIFINAIVIFTCSLWTVYFGLELQWMLLVILILIYDPVWSGLVNYILLNSMISIWLIIGVLLANWLFILVGLMGKIGFFPFSVLVCYQYYLTSFNWIIADLLNNVSYFNGFVITIDYSGLIVGNFVEWLVLLNFMIIMFFIKFILSINHLILISSLQLFLFVLCGMCLDSVLFYVLFYVLLNSIFIVCFL